ncbi:MAG: 23S rRNA (uracil(1939)-C(5))-methyltransferase RlmD [Clostridia bacterium]
MNKNDIIQLNIESYGEGGEGVARFDGMAVFVPFTIKGETVKARIILLKKSYAIGKLEEIIVRSPDRVEPKCDAYTKCGGCQLQHMSEKTQSEFKKSKVKECVNRIAFIDFEPADTVSGENKWRYRNKLQLPLTDNNGLVGGFFAPFSHRIIEIKDCAIQDETSLRIFHALKEYADENNVKGYTEFNHKGLLRHLVTRNTDGGTLVTVVINGKILPSSTALLKKLDALNIKYGLYINENTDQTNVIVGDKFTHIGGLKTLETCENGITYTVVPQSFLQINEEIKEEIYQDAIKKANITANDIVVNAYSGAGLLTAYLANVAKHAYGIEIVKEATDSADELAKRNNLTNKMTNITGDCKAELKKLIPQLKKERDAAIKFRNHQALLNKHVEKATEKSDDVKCQLDNQPTLNGTVENKNDNGKIVFILDPPRKGVDLEILQELKTLKPDKIIYISCNPATFARDIGILRGTLSITANGVEKSQPAPLSQSHSDYDLTTLIPYDMFPQTKHVETLACLERK